VAKPTPSMCLLGSHKYVKTPVVCCSSSVWSRPGQGPSWGECSKLTIISSLRQTTELGYMLLCFSLIRASPPVLNMWLQIVKFIVKMSKCAGLLPQEIDFSASNSCRLPVADKRPNTVVNLQKKEFNKLDLNCGSVFLVGQS
jgi:hypothetical protein